MNCPSCAATNPEAAQWCNQCLAPLAHAGPGSLAGPVSPVVPVAAHPAETVEAAETGRLAEARQAGAQRAGGGDTEPLRSGFRRRGEAIEWECAACSAFNTIEVLACGVCGTSLSARYDAAEPAGVRNWTAALALSALLPGAGHVSVGRYASGAVRMALYVLWLLGAVGLSAGAGGRALAVAGPLFLGAAVLWAGSLLDIVARSKGGRELLEGRVMLWLVVGATGLSLLGMVAVGVNAQG